MRPRALLITPVVPADRGNGLAMRVGVWLELLAERHSVDLVVVPLFPSHPSSPSFARRFADTITIAQLDEDRRERGFAGIETAAHQRLRELVARADVLVVFRLYLAHLIDPPGSQSALRILDLDDAEWVRERRLGREGHATAFEDQLTRLESMFDVFTSANPLELEQIASAFPNVVGVHLPNVVREPSTIAVGPLRDNSVHATDLLFVGTLGYQPNVDGILWLLDEVLPELPGTSFTAVGAMPDHELRQRMGGAVSVEANVETVSPWYQASRVAVIPLHAGSGSRTKVIEAWAHGVPVVSTTVGVEGLTGAIESGAALIADTPEAFASACRLVLDSPNVATELVENGRSIYRQRHSIAIAREQIALALERASERKTQ